MNITHHAFVQALKPEHSIALRMMEEPVDPSIRNQVLASELRWHYSTHYLAEQRGEEVLEDILRYSHGAASRAMLGTQLKDELVHTRMFRNIIDHVGLEPRAARYSKGYVDLVKAQSTLSEKVFTFQILTEAVSSGYCEWRGRAFDHAVLSEVDEYVLQDEVRHLKMGHSLLKSCDPDELKTVLTPRRMKELLKAMNAVCKAGIKDDMPAAIFEDLSVQTDLNSVSDLDRMIAKSVLHEFRTLTEHRLRAGAIIKETEDATPL